MISCICTREITYPDCPLKLQQDLKDLQRFVRKINSTYKRCLEEFPFNYNLIIRTIGFVCSLQGGRSYSNQWLKMISEFFYKISLEKDLTEETLNHNLYDLVCWGNSLNVEIFK